MAVFNGGIGNDTFNGVGFEDDIASGFAGNDSLNGGNGNDSLNGGDGNDTLLGGEGNDTLRGDADNDSILGGAGSDFIVGGAGQDSIDGGDGNDVALFEDGVQRVIINLRTGAVADDGHGNVETILNVENLLGTSFNDVIQLGDGDSYVFARAGNDSLTGGNGGNNFVGGSGNDVIDGGAGIDTANYFDDGNDAAGASVQGVVVNLTNQTAVDNWNNTDTLISIENVSGSALADSITGNGQDNSLNGQNGNDTLRGDAGQDFLNGGLGDDSLDGGSGTNDWVFYDGAQSGIVVNLVAGTATGGFGNDTLVGIENVGGTIFNDNIAGDAGDNRLQGRLGNDTLDGSAGNDTIDYYHAVAAVTASLQTGTASGDGNDIFFNFENLSGGAFNDSLTGNGLDNQLNGGDGNDTIVGDAGNDYLDGGAGDDFLDGGSGTGDAAGYYSAASGIVATLANTFMGFVTGGSGNDTLVGIENVYGGNFNDSITGDAGNNNLQGNAGNDTLIGGDGNDYLSGGLGDDVLTGGNGGGDTANYYFDQSILSGVVVNLVAGTATGGAGNDTLSGIENVNGTDFIDTITGDIQANNLEGRGGDDTIRGAAGNDNITGGLGNDSLFGGSGIDTTNYNDAVSGVVVSLLAGTATGGAGNDTLTNFENIGGSDFGDTLTGNSLNNFIDGRNGNDSLAGLEGDDNLQGGNGDDTLVGGVGSDYLNGGDGNDSMLGGTGIGFDFFEGGAGNDYIDGGVSVDFYFGSDTNSVTYRNSLFAVSINMTGVSEDGSVGSGFANKGLGGTDTLLNLTTFTGSGFNDTILGSAAGIFEQFEGGLGDDILIGGGWDPYFQDAFNRVVYQNSPSAVTVDLQSGRASGGSGNDVILDMHGVRGSNFGDTLLGSDTTVFLEQFEGRNGNDTIDGRGGADVVRYGYLSSNVGVYVNLATGIGIAGVGDVDTLINIERVRGSQYNDTLIGGNTDNGVDTLDGRENFRGEAGNDYIDGGAGFDLAEYGGATSGVYAVLGGAAAGFAYDGQGGIDTLLNIERLNGSYYDDYLVGSDTAEYESFEGQAGNDTIDGKGGVDRVLYGGSRAAVTVNLAAGFATEFYVRGGLTMGTDTLLNIEQVSGSIFGDTLIGNAGANSIEGVGGDDTIDGGAGIDTMEGGDGSDTYFVRDVGDVVTETNRLRAVGGDDTVKSFITAAMSSAGYVLGDYVEILRIETTAAANGSGNSLDNTIVANLGDNILDGGTGNDTISFELATNAVTASIDSAAVGVQTTGGSGNDTLLNFENIVGGAGNDSLTGSAARNRIDGGLGADTMVGGLGNDSYFVDNAGDVVIETSAIPGEIDEVISTVTYSLAAQVNVENLELRGSANINGTGNGSANLIEGNVGNNSLTGADGNDTLDGNLGDDTMVGGQGDDTYDVSSAGDVVTELSGAGTGTDLIRSTISYSLVDTDGAGPNGGNVENLRLMGAANIGGSGNGLNNILYAGDGNNLLDGGAGIDTASYAFSNLAVNVNLGTVGAQTTSGSGSDTLVSIENLEGSAFSDNLTGDISANLLVGLAGNDTFNLLAGGDDTVRGGTGGDFINAGGGGTMLIDGGVVTDFLIGLDMNFVSYASATTSVVINLSGITGNGSVGTGTADKGANGIDTLVNINLITGSGFADSITGSNALIYEFFEGGAGNDTINGGLITDLINFDDTNRVSYVSAGSAVNVNLANNLVSGGAGTDNIFNMNQVRGSNFDDTITGSAFASEAFEGGAGDDTIDGGAGGGTNRARYNNGTSAVNINLATGVGLDGQGGTDTLLNIDAVLGSKFADMLIGGNTANGVGATDGLESFTGQAGDDTIDGGAGYDRTDYYAWATEGVLVRLGGSSNGSAYDGQGGVDTLISIEAVRGSNFNDRLFGSDTGVFESFAGMEGNDTIDGKGGADRVEYSQSRAGVIVNLVTGIASDGYGGTDNLINIEDVLGSTFNDVIAGNLGSNKLVGDAGNDNLSASDGADFLDGGDGNDVMAGGAGGDSMLGGAGLDTLSGGKGGDRMFGGDGNDSMNGNLGNDQMTGDAGADVFVFNSPLSNITNVDTIMDFTAGADIIQLSAAIFGAFSGQIGQTIGVNANLLYDSVTGVLSYDADGVGGIAAINFAIIGPVTHPVSMGSDFVIIG